MANARGAFIGLHLRDGRVRFISRNGWGPVARATSTLGGRGGGPACTLPAAAVATLREAPIAHRMNSDTLVSRFPPARFMHYGPIV